jgi:short-subunit dehydrogenase
MRRKRIDFKHHVAIVAGGSGGIGTSVCELLLERGASVVAVRHCLRRPAAVAKGSIDIRADLQSFGEWSRIVRTVMRRFGKIDSLIHCSGILIPGTVSSLSEDQIRSTLEVNVLSFMFGCRSVLPVLCRQKRGHVITIGSLGGVLPMPYEPVYSATKFALRGFALSLSEELRGTGVHCSIISSGPVTTRMLDEEAHDPNSIIAFITKPMTPANVAGTVLKLLSHPRPELMLPRGAGFSSRLLAFNSRLFGLIFRFLTPYGEWRRKRYIKDRTIVSNP